MPVFVPVPMSMPMTIPVPVVMVVVVMARGFLMAMVTVNDVGRDELVQEARNGLDPDESSNKTCHHDEPRGLVGPAILLKILFRLGQHAVERREKLQEGASAT